MAVGETEQGIFALCSALFLLNFHPFFRKQSFLYLMDVNGSDVQWAGSGGKNYTKTGTLRVNINI